MATDKDNEGEGGAEKPASVDAVTDKDLHTNVNAHGSREIQAPKPSPEITQQGIKSSPLAQEEADPEKPAEQPQRDYSIFSPWAKKWIVVAATLGAFYSPFTAQIYFPALTSIAQGLGVSNSKVNLTMTTYMVRAFLAHHKRGMGLSVDADGQ